MFKNTLVFLAVATTVAACGGTATNQTTSIPNAKAVVSDCSSFKKFAPKFVPTMVTDVKSVALENPAPIVYTGCFDGAPKRTLALKTTNFGEMPEHTDPETAKALKLARAQGMKKQLASMVKTPEKVRGSGQLELFEVLSEIEGLNEVFLYSDLLVNQVDGLDLSTATDAEVDAVVKRWVPRCRGLRGVKVVATGAGLGGASTERVRHAEQLLRGVVEGAGGSFDVRV